MIPAVIVIDLDPNVFQAGPFLITWHGVFSVLGILAAARMGQWLASRDGVDREKVYDGAFWMVVVGIVGARLLYVWENYRQFAGQPLRVLALNEGGISQWGGLFGAMAGAYLWCRRSRVPFWKIIDAGGPAALIGLAIGRIGDVINGEHHAIASNLPWAVEYINEKTLGEHGKPVHSEVAYEMLWSLLLLAILLPLHSRLKARLPAGVTGLLYLSVYAAGRFVLSFLRTDSLAFGLRQAQWASLAMIAAAVLAAPLLYRRGRRVTAEPAG